MANRLSQMRGVGPSSSSASSSGHHQDGKRGKKPPPPPPGGPPGPRAKGGGGGVPSKRQSAKSSSGSGGGGSNRSIASLMGVTPKSATGMATKSSDGGVCTSGAAAAAHHQRPKRIANNFKRSNSSTSSRSQASQKRPSIQAPPTPSSPTPAANTAEMALAQARQRAGVKRPSSVSLASSPGKGNASSSSDKPQLKRPAMRRTILPTASSQGNASIMSSASIAKRTSSASAAGAGGSLSSLLLSNTDTAKYLGPNAPKLLKHYAKIEPNDYWKNIRGWDFIHDLNEKGSNANNHHHHGKKNKHRGSNHHNHNHNHNHNHKQNHHGSNNNDGKKRPRGNSGNDTETSNTSSNTTTNNTTTAKQPDPIPDTFTSYREYCALWAPLCLDEARAQLLSDAITEIPYWKSKAEKSPVKVRLRPAKKDVNGTSESMAVQVKEVLTSNYRDRGFMSNDIVLLVKKESVIWDASKGTLNRQHSQHQQHHQQQQVQKQPRQCIVGNIEYSRRSLDGLNIQISRERWSEAGSAEMVLLNLGCNITSLREFTALCRMDSIPLLDYILGGKMSSSSSSTSAALVAGKKTAQKSIPESDDEDPSLKEKRAKKVILSSMGGSSALGKGFAEYAYRKFNLSQLGAIASSAEQYGDGGFTLIKGPPGTGKTTTLCALLNALHIRQMNTYFKEVKNLAESYDAVVGKRASLSLSDARKKRPRILVCAPSNAAVDNVILKIMEDGFVDGNGCRYNPSIARIGRGQSASVKDVCLEEKVESYISDATDLTKLENRIEGYQAERRRIHMDITKLRQRMNAIKKAVDYPLAKDWEIRIDEESARVYFVNHKEKTTTYEVPPPPEPGQRHFPAEAMPEYKTFVSSVVKMVERYNNISTELEGYSLCKEVPNAIRGGAKCAAMNAIRQQVETHILDSIHIVMTTLGTAGNRSLEAANKFEVVVIDEAAQSVEPSTLAGLQLGSKHCILVGDPQQLPATIFNVSGRNTKYDRSLFQRLEEAGHGVHLLNTQYRMHPGISNFPRRIFYDGKLLDGPNVKHPEYGNPLKRAVFKKFESFQAFTVLDLESSEERGGTSLSNSAEAQLALHLFMNLKLGTNGLSTNTRVAVITPYSQQAALLRRTFSDSLGAGYERFVEVSSVDAFQGREANIVIFSCVRAAGSKGIGFLSDVRRMNVALTRAKHFLFVIARCSSIVVNPYWRDLVDHARETEAVIEVPFSGSRQSLSFPNLWTLKAMPPPQKSNAPVHRKRQKVDRNISHNTSNGRGYKM